MILTAAKQRQHVEQGQQNDRHRLRALKRAHVILLGVFKKCVHVVLHCPFQKSKANATAIDVLAHERKLLKAIMFIHQVNFKKS